MNVLEMKLLTCLVGVTRMDSVRNDVCRKAGIERQLGGRVDQNVAIAEVS